MISTGTIHTISEPACMSKAAAAASVRYPLPDRTDQRVQPVDHPSCRNNVTNIIERSPSLSRSPSSQLDMSTESEVDRLRAAAARRAKSTRHWWERRAVQYVNNNSLGCRHTDEEGTEY
jgi:hypothetical protein